MDELTAFLKARWDDLERIAQDGKAACAHLDLCGDSGGEWWEHFGHENGPDLVLADIASKRQILAEHKPVRGHVEWPDDQDGTGHAWICPRCQNAENDSRNWNPSPGQAGVFPHENFVTAYVLAPCKTLRLLVQPFAGHPDFREEWKA